MMKYLRALLIFFLALVLAGFIQQNSQSVILKYFGYNTAALPLSLFMIVAFALGYLLAILVGLTGTVRGKFKLLQSEKEVKRLKSEATQYTDESEDSKETTSETPEEKDGKNLSTQQISPAADWEDSDPEGDE
jgi:uncharacterized integral membrane protein